ncbi:MAG: VOC family protein [Candidatus Methylomirabilales bacterium]
MIRLDHVGILVRSIQEALPLYIELLGLTADPAVELTEQQVRVVFLHAGDGQIELLEPMTSDCLLAQVLEKRGEGLLHLCLEVEDIEGVLRKLEAAGLRLVDRHAWLSPHGLAAFVHPTAFHGVSIELRQKVRPERGGAGSPDSKGAT